MRVFVTGASGWIGSAAVPELVAAGHQVTGLARSTASAAAVEAAGAEVVRGDIEDLAVLREAAAASDAAVHLAFRHDIAFSGGFARAVESDLAAIRVMGEALPAGGAFSVAGGILGLARAGSPATERDRPEAGTAAAGRQICADAALSFAERGLRTSVVRLSPTVHGEGDGGFIPTLIALARQRASRGTPAPARRGGPRWPSRTRPASSGWRSRSRRQARSCTGWPTRASRSGRSPK